MKPMPNNRLNNRNKRIRHIKKNRLLRKEYLVEEDILNKTVP
jgi:hypothetical protein